MKNICKGLLSSLFVLYTIQLSFKIENPLNKHNSYFFISNAKAKSRFECPGLQNSIDLLISQDKKDWSISILNQYGDILADINGNQPRIPASNQKLITTAMALDKLGPRYELSTTIYRMKDGSYELIGQGDPDLGYLQIQSLLVAAVVNHKSNLGIHKPINIVIRDIPEEFWWPDSWPASDRLQEYGSPITSIALSSNGNEVSINRPKTNLIKLIKQELIRLGVEATISTKPRSEFNFKESQLIHSEYSASMMSLLSLTNAVSHNFIAEVLHRHSSGTWNPTVANINTYLWLSTQNLPTKNVIVADGSGLSRKNKVTTRLLSKLLYTMENSPYSTVYKSSMAVSGLRGTLRYYFNDKEIDGRFFGKTGTLSGVRSVSGIYYSRNGNRFVSIIKYGSYNPNQKIGNILRSIDKYKCKG